MKFAIAALFAIVIAFVSLPATTQGAPGMQRAVNRYNVRPKLAPTTFVSVLFPSPHPSYIGIPVFLPNGTAYFTVGPNEIASFTSSGVYTRIAVPHAASESILYAHGVFWMAGNQGIVKVAPDGSKHRWLSLSVPGSVTYVQSIAATPDGVYAIAILYPKTPGAQTNVLFHIDLNGSYKMTVLSVIPSGAASILLNNLLYFSYTDNTGAAGVARVESNGSLTLFPIAGCYQTTSYVVSNGSIYFDYLYYNPKTSVIDGKLGRITPAGNVSLASFPATGSNTLPTNLAADHGGNLWVVVDDLFAVNGSFLYQFNTYTGHFNGPYLTGLANNLPYSPAIAPDDDVWIALTSMAPLTYDQPVGFGIFERGS